MTIQGLDLLTAYGSAAHKPATPRQTSPGFAENLADSLSRSGTAATTNEEQTIQKQLDAIKAKPGVQRTEADTAYLSAHDKRFIEIQDKIKDKGSESLTANELDYLQKAAGFVNTMAYLSPNEKALYDELVAKGNTEAAQGLGLLAMSRIGMEGQQVTLPNGRSFDPTHTEVTADNVRNLFKYLFVDADGTLGHKFEALAAYLDQRPADTDANKTATSKPGNTYDFSHISPEKMLSTMNSLVRAGKLTPDETSALVGMIPTTLSKVIPDGQPSAAHDQPTDFFALLKQAKAFNLSTHNDAAARYDQLAFDALKRVQGTLAG